MMSGLSLATNHPGADSAVFIAVGTMDEEIPLTEEVRRTLNAMSLWCSLACSLCD